MGENEVSGCPPDAIMPAPSRFMKNPDETAMVNMPNPIRTAQTASRSLSVMGRSFRSFTDERKCFSIWSPAQPALIFGLGESNGRLDK